MLHNYRSRQFHITLNGINPSSGFKDMPSKNLAQVLPHLTSFGPYGAHRTGTITMTMHYYKSRKVHKTVNELNPSSGFRDLRPAMFGPNLCQIWQVSGPWASPYGANGKMAMTVHNHRPKQFHRTWNRENLSRSYRDMGSASLAATFPPTRQPIQTVTTIPL